MATIDENDESAVMPMVNEEEHQDIASPPPKAESKKGGKKKKEITLKDRIRHLVIRIAVIGIVVWLLTNVIGGVSICHTNDMYPSLRDGDLVITYRLGTYRSGDIVVYSYEGKDCYGRIVGEPGDEIFIDESGVYTVNGLRPYETIYYDTKTRESDTMQYPYTIGEQEYFVLVDAREDGFDSRNIGPIKELKGKVVLQLRRRGF